MRQKATLGRVAIVISSAALMATFVYWRATGTLPFAARAEPPQGEVRGTGAGSVGPVYSADAGSVLSPVDTKAIPTLNAPHPLAGSPPVVGVTQPIPPTSLAAGNAPYTLPPPIWAPVNQLAADPPMISTSKSGAVVKPSDVARVIQSVPEIAPQNMMLSSKSGAVVQPQAMMGSSKSLTIAPVPTLAAFSAIPVVAGTVAIPSQIVPSQPSSYGAIESRGMLNTSKSGSIVLPSTVVTLMSPTEPNGTAASIVPPKPKIVPQQLMVGSKAAVVVRPQGVVESLTSMVSGSPAGGVEANEVVVVPRQITQGRLVIESGSLMSTSKSGSVVDPSTVIRVISTNQATSVIGSTVLNFPAPTVSQQPVAPSPEMVPPDVTVRTESRMMTGSKFSTIVDPSQMSKVLTIQLAPPATRPSTQPGKP